MKLKIFLAIVLFASGLVFTPTSHAQTNSLTIVSPQAQQVWAAGSTQTILWMPNDILNPPVSTTAAPTAYITLTPVSTCTPTVTTTCPAISATPYLIAQDAPNTGIFSWAIPASLPQPYVGTDTINVNLSDNSYQGTSGVITVTPSVAGTTNPGSAATTTSMSSAAITQLSPNSGPVGTSVTISGPGLASWGNTVQFGPGNYISNASSTPSGSSTTLQFMVPPQSVPCPPWNTGACAAFSTLITPGTYNVALANASGVSNVLPFTVTADTPTSTTSSLATTTALANGSLFMVTGSPTVYLVNNGAYMPFTTAQVFLARGYKWSDIQILPPNQFNAQNVSSTFVPAPDNTLVKSNTNATVYLVTNNGQKSPIPSMDVYSRLGLSTRPLITLSNNELLSYPITSPQQ